MSIDWQDTRRKLWHAFLMAAVWYVSTDPRFAGLAPILTGVAGLSQPPTVPATAVRVVVVGALAGLGARVLWG